MAAISPVKRTLPAFSSRSPEERRSRPVQSGLPAAGVAGKVHSMPLTVFDCKGIFATGRERIEAAVEAAAGQRLAQPYESWTAVDRLPGGVRLLNTGPQGFERTVAFAATKRRRRLRTGAGRRCLRKRKLKT